MATGPILVVGDSLSAEYGLQRGAGWVELLAKRLAAQRPPGPPVVNASISGDTTAGGRNRLPALLDKHRPSIVIIELGGNDALRGLDLKMTETNLRAMLAEAKKAGVSTLLLGMMVPPNYGKAYGDRFSGMFKTVAQAEQSALVPFLLEGVAERNDLFQADRIHPNEQAQPRMLDNVWPALETLLEGSRR
ncbi:MAG: arylesterase [Burkholderiaceae bacterium]